MDLTTLSDEELLRLTREVIGDLREWGVARNESMTNWAMRRDPPALDPENFLASAEEAKRFFLRPTDEFNSRFRPRCVEVVNEIARRLEREPPTSFALAGMGLTGPTPVEELVDLMQRLVDDFAGRS